MKVPLNGIITLPNIMKIYQAVQKLLVVDTQTGDLISLLSFLENRLIMKSVFTFCNSVNVFMFVAAQE
jgi:hypothetical protein